MLRRLAVSFAVVAAAATPFIVLQSSQPSRPPPEQRTQPAHGARRRRAVEGLKATVTGVEGVVQVRTAEDQPWQKATVGMVLDAERRVPHGPASAVRFTIPPDQTITLDRLGTVKVLQAVNEDGKIKTNLGMKYGRTRYDIEAAGREHESTISSPSSTLAVRGTKVSLYDQPPFAAQAVSLTGRREFRDARKRIALRRPGRGQAEGERERRQRGRGVAAGSVRRPRTRRWRARTRRQRSSPTCSPAARRSSYDTRRASRSSAAARVPVTDQELIPVLPGALNFVLRWTGNADLNLAVLSPTPLGVRATAVAVYPIGG